MCSQPSGPPPVRANGNDYVMASRQYVHVHERILLLREDHIGNIRQNPPKIVFRVCHHHGSYILILLLVVVVHMELWTHEINGSFEESVHCDYARQTFITIVVADVYSHHHIIGRDTR